MTASAVWQRSRPRCGASRTLVAREASQVEVFAAVADAVSGLLGRRGTDGALRSERRGRRGRFGRPSRARVSRRQPGTARGQQRRVARLPDTGSRFGSTTIERPADRSRTPLAPTGLRSVVATPIVVEGRLWGTMLVAAFRDEPIAPENGKPAGPVHRARRHRARERGESCRACSFGSACSQARRGASGSAAGCDPRRPRVVAGRALRRGRGRSRASHERPNRCAGSLRARRIRDTVVGGWSEGAFPVPIGGR